MTKTNNVGFIGGMEIPVIDTFKYGYMAGVKNANSNGELNNIDFTFFISLGNSSSTIANFWFGYNPAPSSIAEANFSPTPNIKSTSSSTNVSILVA